MTKSAGDTVGKRSDLIENLATGKVFRLASVLSSRIHDGVALKLKGAEMTITLQELKATASGLPLVERAALAHYLLGTLEKEEEGVADEWLALAERRMSDIRTGRVVGVPAEQVLESMKRPRP